MNIARTFRLLATALLLSTGRAEAQTPLYLDPGQPTEKRIADLISRMTPEEKANQLFWGGGPNDRLHIPAFGGWNQCLHGVWSTQPTTLFPVSIALAATWDPVLVHTEADAISDEARALYNSRAEGPSGPQGLIERAPVINISRDPRWGRIQECYGEDPYLTGRMGVAYVQGLQGDNPQYLKVAATLKHFAVNNQEDGRLSLSADVPERMLYEYWLPHWKACVVEGHAQSVMAAYNSVDGTPCAINKRLLTDILRDQWGFDGFVVSDLGGIRHLIDGHHITTRPEIAAGQAILAGCDYDDQEYRDALPAALQQGLVSEADIDRALTRVLRVAFRLGVFDPPDGNPYTNIPPGVIDSPAHRALALKTAQESIVLLTNRNGFLPLDRTAAGRIAVIGPMGDQFETGSYFGKKPALVGPLAGIKNSLGPGAEVTYTPGCSVTGAADDAASVAQAAAAARGADTVILCLGTNSRVEAEGRDRHDLSLPAVQEQLLEAVAGANPKTVLVLMNGGPLAVSWAKAHLPAILETWYNGEEAGNALADVLFGDTNPGGKLPYTVYGSTNDIPLQTEYDITKGFTYLYFRGTPLFPFGHGLSYTQFGYGGLTLSARHIAAGGTVGVSVTVQNMGRRPGDEVAQLYVHQESSRAPQPRKRLIGFQRIHLAPGEKQTVRFNVPVTQLAWYDTARHGFVVEPGTYDILAGSSSEDIRAQGKLTVTAR